MQNRRISLASGVLPECDPVTVARAAVAAGYSDAGIMVRPEAWDSAWEADLLEIKAEHGIGYLDVEVLWIPAGAQLDAGHQLIVEVGGRLGADHLLAVSDEADARLLAPALETISAWCKEAEIKPMLEFLRITEVQSLSQAQALLAASAEHDFGILIDSLHLARSGELFELPALDASMHPYIQLCDAPASCADDRETLLRDALDARSAPGEGELPLAAVLRALPSHVPLSMEVRSIRYREDYPDPIERARAVLNQTKSYLAQFEQEEKA